MNKGINVWSNLSALDHLLFCKSIYILGVWENPINEHLEECLDRELGFYNPGSNSPSECNKIKPHHNTLEDPRSEHLLLNIKDESLLKPITSWFILFYSSLLNFNIVMMLSIALPVHLLKRILFIFLYFKNEIIKIVVETEWNEKRHIVNYNRIF